MQIQKIQIKSSLVCYGPCPLPDEEVEQHLTISSSGRVWFVGYNFGGGFGEYIIGRRQQLSIGKELASKLLGLISDYLENNDIFIFTTDIGNWNINITDIDGNKYEESGSLCGGVTAGKIDLTDFIKQNIPINNLAVFGGGCHGTN